MQFFYNLIYRSSFAILLGCFCLSDTVSAITHSSSGLTQNPPSKGGLGGSPRTRTLSFSYSVRKSYSLLLAQQPASSQNKPQAPEPNVQVAEVVVKGAEGKLLDLVRQTAKIKPGGMTTRSGLQADINAIFATGYFSNVEAVPEDVSKGVRVTFIVVTNPVLRRVELSGNTLVPVKTINEIFSQQYGSILNLGTLTSGTAKLNKWYQDNGYIVAKVASPNVSKDGIVKLKVAEGVVENIQVRFVDKDGKDKDDKGKPITARTPPAAILKRVRLIKPGQIVNRSQAEKDLQNVLKLGVFDDVQMKFNPGKDNQTIALIEVVENDLASDAAFIQLQEELDTIQAKKNPIEEAKILRKQGHLLYSKDKYQKAVEKYQAAIKLLQSEKDIIGIAKIYNNIGNTYYKEKTYNQAISNYQNALKNYRSKQNKLGEAIVSNNLGNTYIESKQYDKAVDSYNKAQQVFAELKEPFWQAISLHNLAFSYYFSDNKDKAIASHNQVISFWKSIKQNPADINKLLENDNTKPSIKTGSIYFGLATSTKAGTYFQATLQLDETLTNKIQDKRLWLAGTLFNSANVFRTSGDYQQAIYSYNDALELWKSLNFGKLITSISDSSNINWSNTLNTLFDSIGKISLYQTYNDLGQKQLSSQYSQQLVDMLKKEGSVILASIQDNNQNSAQLKNIVSTFAPIFINLFTQRQTGTISNETIFHDFYPPLMEYLKQYLSQNKDKQFTTFFETFFKYFNAITNTTSADKLAQSDDNNKKQQALKFYQQNLVTLKSIKDEDLCFDKLLSMFDLQKVSLNQQQNKIKNLCFLSLKGQQAKTLNAIAKLQLDFKENQQAILSLKQALTLTQTESAKPVENPKNQQKIQELVNQIQAISQNSNSNDLSQFEPLLKTVKTIFADYSVKEAKTNTAEALALLGQAYVAEQNYQKASEFYNSSLMLWQATDNVIKQADTRLAIANMERTSGNLTQSKTEIEKAIETIESERAQTSYQEQQQQQHELGNDDDKNKFPQVIPKPSSYKSYLDLANYLESKQSYYDFYIDLLMQLHNKQPKAGYDGLAFQASERSKSRSLRAILNKSLNQNLSKTKQAKTSETSYVELAKVPSLSEIQQQLLDDNTLLLEYTLGKERSYLWAITKNSIQTYQLPKRAEIDALSRQFIELLKSPAYRLGTRGINVVPNGETINSSQVPNQLSQILIAPIAEKLANKRLLIVSDGVLQYVPFAALPKSAKDKDIKPLLVDHEIVGLPSASLQTLLKRGNTQKQKPSQTLAMFADPIFSRSDERVKMDSNTISPVTLFKRLPGTRKEANQITSLIPSQKLIKLDSAASYQAATSPELSKYRFIHFATHGVFDAQRPERSGVIFSAVNEQGELQRSLLSTPDAFRLNLSSDLVVLSACTTALGKEIKGEGLIGLTGGLMYAGSKSVVSSFWDVDDGGTAELMTRFYSKMLKDNLSPTAALRTAQLEMWNLSKWQAPYYWAAFTIQGDTRR